MLDFICPYCGKPAGKSELGYLLLVHPEHQAGTLFWAKWYRQQRKEGKRQTEVGDALFEICESKMVSPTNIGLLKMQELNRLKNSQKGKS